jgi:hypothetical protein
MMGLLALDIADTHLMLQLAPYAPAVERCRSLPTIQGLSSEIRALRLDTLTGMAWHWCCLHSVWC